jgi:hypothetical protein
VAVLIHKVCAEFCWQVDELRSRSRNQQNCCLIICFENFVADRDSLGKNFILQMGWRRMNDRHENHAQNHSEKQRVEAGDETAHVSSNAGALVREC